MLPEYIKKDINDSFNRITASFEAFWQITIKLGDGCTLACLHCSHHCEKPSLIHVSNVLKIIDKCKLLNLTKSILLTGGEPLIYPEVDKIFKKLHCENIPFDVNTCLLVDIKNVEKLVSYNVRCLRYSIYGHTKEEHNAFTHRDSWDIVVKNGKYLGSIKDKTFRVEINLNVTIYNYRSLLDRILWIIDTFNPNDINLCPIYDVKELQLSSKDVEYYYKKVYPDIEILCKENKFTQLPVRAYLLFGQNEGKNYFEGNRYYVSHEANCYAGSANIFIDNFGKIYPCVSHQVHRFMDNHICLGTLQYTEYLTKLIIDKKTPCYNPNDNEICRNYCPIFFGRANKYIDFLIQGER